jgi:hypothetical protein
MQDISRAIADDLNLDVAGALDEAFQVKPTVAKRALRLAGRFIE